MRPETYRVRVDGTGTRWRVQRRRWWWQDLYFGQRWEAAWLAPLSEPCDFQSELQARAAGQRATDAEARRRQASRWRVVP